MSAATSYRMTPDEAFLQTAVKKGQAFLQELSMKSLGKPDAALQCRVQHLDIGHVRRLSAIHDDTGNIAPIVVFEDPVSGSRWLADGFHRHRMLQIKKAESIWAYVVKGTRTDALVFATMCNRQLCLPRTREDIKKAILMLMEEANWLRKPAKDVAAHVGTTETTVTKYRLQFCQERDIDPETIDERIRLRRITRRPPAVFKPDPLSPQESPWANLTKRKPGERPTVTEAVEEMKREAIKEFIDSGRSEVGDNIVYYLREHGLHVQSIREYSGQSFEGLWGFVVISRYHCDLVTWVEFTPIRLGDFTAAIGRLALLKHMLGKPFRRKVILGDADGGSRIYLAANELGYLLMSPERFIGTCGTDPDRRNRDSS